MRFSARALRARHMSKIFVASTDLRPMAQQLLQNRSSTAYAGVERYARIHVKEDVAPLAWLTLGYAHILDHQPALAIPDLKKAQPRAGELTDYVDYFLGSAQEASGDATSALRTLENFDDRHPGSVFSRDAAVVEANAFLAQRDTASAIALLESHRTPPRPDVELVLGRAEEQAGHPETAAAEFRRVFYEMPLAAEAVAAQIELQKLVQAGALAPVPASVRKKRADVLAQNHRADDAVDEYRALLQNAAEGDRPELTLDLASALMLSGRSREAQDLLEKLPQPSGEQGPRRLYYLTELSRPDEEKVGNYVSQMRAESANSEWFAEALLSASNMYLLRDDYGTAARFLSELAERFPKGKHAPFASWRAGWLHFRMGDVEQAKQDFERHIALYPASAEVAGAMYWRGRIAEEQQEPSTARAYYAKTAETFRSEYYGDLSRERLRDLGIGGEKAQLALLDKIDDPKPSIHYSVTAPEDNIRLQKALLLENCGMVDFGVRELQAAKTDSGGNWGLAQIAQLYSDSGLYYRSLQSVKHALPGYYSFDMNDLPRKFWEDLFPRPYWGEVKRYSGEYGLNPFLVASLIRQESEFNPNAISHAQAIGLMQLLPKVGKNLAKEVRLKHFDTSMLLDPGTNLQLGTRYLHSLLIKYNGQVEYALAAYNAGSERVDGWRNAKYRDVYEFVESIPFTETRGYVQAIVRNRELYEELYGTP